MTASPDSIALDKLDVHHRQQLSALMDGALTADEARFLMRRLQHDGELAGCWERWQLCGDVLRGQAQAPAPAGFAERVARAVAAEVAPSTLGATQESRRGRGVLARWGGGALAASVALVALFMARQQAPQDAPTEAPALASQQVPATPTAPAVPAAPDAQAYAAAAVAVASVPRRQDSTARRSATRTQQAARAARTARVDAPTRAVAASSLASMPASSPLASPANPFAQAADNVAPQARPWPRSTLSGYPAAGGLTTGYTSDSAARTFYPFEPRLPATPPVAPPDDAREE